MKNNMKATIADELIRHQKSMDIHTAQIFAKHLPIKSGGSAGNSPPWLNGSRFFALPMQFPPGMANVQPAWRDCCVCSLYQSCGTHSGCDPAAMPFIFVSDISILFAVSDLVGSAQRGPTHWTKGTDTATGEEMGKVKRRRSELRAGNDETQRNIHVQREMVVQPAERARPPTKAVGKKAMLVSIQWKLNAKNATMSNIFRMESNELPGNLFWIFGSIVRTIAPLRARRMVCLCMSAGEF